MQPKPNNIVEVTWVNAPFFLHGRFLSDPKTLYKFEVKHNRDIVGPFKAKYLNETKEIIAVCMLNDDQQPMLLEMPRENVQLKLLEDEPDFMEDWNFVPDMNIN